MKVSSAPSLAELRSRAEHRLAAGQRPSLTLVPTDTGEVVRELQLYRTELEMQNEELRETQLMLLEANQRYRRLYDDAPIAYVTLDQRGRIIEANRATSELLLTPRHALLGISFSRFLAEAEGDRFHLHRWEVLAGTGRRSLEIDLECPDGRRVAVRLESIGVNTSIGIECWSALIDISKEQVMERELTDRARQLSAVLEGIADGVVRFDGKGVIEWTSSAATSLLGCDARELLGSPVDELLVELQKRGIDVKVRQLHDHSFVAILTKR